MMASTRVALVASTPATVSSRSSISPAALRDAAHTTMLVQGVGRHLYSHALPDTGETLGEVPSSILYSVGLKPSEGSAGIRMAIVVGATDTEVKLRLEVFGDATTAYSGYVTIPVCFGSAAERTVVIEERALWPTLGSVTNRSIGLEFDGSASTVRSVILAIRSVTLSEIPRSLVSDDTCLAWTDPASFASGQPITTTALAALADAQTAVIEDDADTPLWSWIPPGAASPHVVPCATAAGDWVDVIDSTFPAPDTYESPSPGLTIPTPPPLGDDGMTVIDIDVLCSGETDAVEFRAVPGYPHTASAIGSALAHGFPPYNTTPGVITLSVGIPGALSYRDSSLCDTIHLQARAIGGDMSDALIYQIVAHRRRIGTPVIPPSLAFAPSAGSGLSRVGPMLTIDGITVEAELYAEGTAAVQAGSWVPTKGPSLAISGAGTDPTCGHLTFFTDHTDASVLFGGAGNSVYRSASTAASNPGLRDIVARVVARVGGTAGVLAAKRLDHAGAGWVISEDSSQRLSFVLSDGTTTVTVLSAALPIGAWYDSMCFMDRSGSGQWTVAGINSGSAVDISALAAADITVADGVSIGGYYDETSPCVAAIALVGVWMQ